MSTVTIKVNKSFTVESRYSISLNKSQLRKVVRLGLGKLTSDEPPETMELTLDEKNCSAIITWSETKETHPSDTAQ